MSEHQQHTCLSSLRTAHKVGCDLANWCRFGLLLLLPAALLLAPVTALAQVAAYTFTLGERTLGETTALGTLTAINSPYTIDSITAVASGFATADKFAIDASGDLSFIGTAAEDVAANASYAIVVSGNVSVSGSTSSATVTVLVKVGICDRVALVRNAIVSKISGVSSCGAVTAAGLGSVNVLDVTDSNPMVTQLPNGSFAGLSSMGTLAIVVNGLSSLGDEVFADLDDLRHLTINAGALTTIPPALLNLRNLNFLNLDSNALTALPEAFSFATLGGLNGAFNSLVLSNNDLRQLPPGVFEGVTINGGNLDVSNNPNPGDVFEVALALEQLSFSGVLEFRARSALAGPAINVTWSVTSTNGSIETGTVSIAGGSVASNVFAPTLSDISTVRLTGTDIDTAIYQGFAPQLPPLLTLGAPQFDQPFGYAFTLESIPTEIVVVGTITASDPNTPIRYTIVGGEHGAAYRIGQLGGDLALINPSQVKSQRVHLIVVEARDANELANTIGVTVYLQNPAPSFTDTGPFSIPTRTLGSTVVLGTVKAQHSIDIIEYSLDNNPGNQFSIGADSGVLAFTSNAFEDVSLTERYTVRVLASTASLFSEANIVVSVGICDRTPWVQNALQNAASITACDAINLASLGTISGTLAMTGDSTLTALRAFDFGGLVNLSAIDLSDNGLDTLPARVFAGLSALTHIDVSGNSSPIFIPLWVELLSADSFRVRSAFPGPALRVGWTAMDANGSGFQSPPNQLLSLPAGAEVSEEVNPSQDVNSVFTNPISSAMVHNPAFDPAASNYPGFVFQLLDATVAGAPQFEQPQGYIFTLALDADIVGQVTALDESTVSYAITDGTYRDSYSINSSGQLSYSGQHSETAHHVLVVQASDGAQDSEVSVSIRHDRAPYISNNVFTVPSRALAVSVLIGTVVASDPDSDTMTGYSYSLATDSSGKFSLSDISGDAKLYFNSDALEDVTLTPAYTLIIQTTRTAPNQTSFSPITVNIGICDRPAPVRDRILDNAGSDNVDNVKVVIPDSCGAISVAHLASVDGNLKSGGRDQVGAGGLTAIGPGTLHLPHFTFAGLDKIVFLNIELKNLESIADQTFVGLSSLKQLRIGRSFGSAFTTLPQAVLNARDLDDFTFRHQLAELPEMFYNQDTGMTEAFSFAKLGGSDGEFSSLYLANNNLTQLPPRVFEGVRISSGGTLDVSDNPNSGDAFEVALEVEELPYVSSSSLPRFRVRSALPGPAITVSWSVSNTSGSRETGEATIAGGSDASVVFTPTLPDISSISLTGTAIDPVTYTGFDPQLAGELRVGLPLFSQPGGYTFSLLNAVAGQAVVVGNVMANSNAALNYAIVGGAQSDSYTINSGSGVLRYNGAGNETIVSQVLVIRAAKTTAAADAATVNVTIHVDVPFRFAEFGPFYLESEAKNTAVVIGTVKATDDNGDDPPTSYTISTDPSAKFSINASSGELYFRTAVAEDVSLIAAYTVRVAALSAAGQTASTEVVLNIGICDRPAPVRDRILANAGSDNVVIPDSCGAISVAHLASVNGTLKGSGGQDQAGAGGLTAQGSNTRDLPHFTFAGLDKIVFLNIELENLESIADQTFVGLSSLKQLRIGRSFGSAFTTLPQAVLNARGLEELIIGRRLSELPEMFYNQDTGMTEAFSFAKLSSNGVFVHLGLSNNNLTQLPPGVFEGVTISGETLDVSINPGAPFPVGLTLSRVSTTNFRIVSDIAGPAINVTWSAPGGNVAADSITIGGGATASSPFTPGGTFETVRISSASIVGDGSTYKGFALALLSPLLTVGAPQFDQPFGYMFDLAQATAGMLVGTVVATDFESDAFSYAIRDGVHSQRYTIDSSSGVLRYRGDGNETAVSQMLTIEAKENSSLLASTVGVTINVNTPPQFAVGPFYLPQRDDASERTLIQDGAGNAVVIASDANGSALSFSIGSVTAANAAVSVGGKFSIDNAGVLGFDSAAFEDVALNASYAINISVSDGVYQRNATLTVNIGICDRIALVREAIIAQLTSGSSSCSAITATALSGVTSLTIAETPGSVTLLPNGSFAALSNMVTLAIAVTGLSDLEAEVFANLDGLQHLTINTGALVSIPRSLLSLRGLSALDLSGNALTALPPAPFSFAQLAAVQGFATLDLSDNALTQLPPRAFEEVQLTSSGRLDVSDNPSAGDRLAVRLAVAPVIPSDGARPSSFYIASDIAGPSASVSWRVNNATPITGSAAIDGGSRTSTVFTPQTNSVSSLSLTGATFGSNYVGFEPQLAPPLTFDAPLFGAPLGYYFNLDASAGQTIVGTVSAFDSVRYAIFDGAHSTRYTIDNNTGELRYSGDGNETIASQVLMVEATSNSNQGASVSVNINVNVPLAFTALGPFHVTSTIKNAAVVIGTVIAADDNGDDPVTSYAINTDPSAKFSINASSGELYFSTAVDEDLGLTAAYTVGVTARTAGGQSASAQAVLNIGICNRTPEVLEVLNELQASDQTGLGCARATLNTLGFINVLDVSQRGISVLQPFDFAALENVQQIDLSGNAITSLPEELFGNLGELLRLILRDNPLSTLPEQIFSDLNNLRELDLANLALSALPAGLLNGVPIIDTLRLNGNRFTTLPAPLEQAFSDRTALNLKALYLNDNALTALPMSGSFAHLGRDGVTQSGVQVDGALNTLELSGNKIGHFPQGVFAGLNINNLLNVSDNPQPGSNVALTASIRQLAPVGGDWQLEVSTSIAGPPLDLTYQTITSGAVATNTIALSAGASSTAFTVATTVEFVALSDVEIGSAFQGFAAQVDSIPVPVGAPAFEQNAYQFSFDIDAQLLGTVRAFDLDAGNSVSHSIISGATAARYSINEASGALSYTAGGGETIATQVLIVQATNNGQRNATVSVTLIPNTVPQLTSSDTFYIGARALGSAVPVGTIVAKDADGDPILSYSLLSNPGDKFSLAMVDGMGLLSFISSDLEDLSLSAAYVLPLEVFSNRIQLYATISVTVGICDRSPAVQTAILANVTALGDCTRITREQLEAYSGTLAVEVAVDAPLAALQSFDFAALANLRELRLIDSGRQLRNLPQELFYDLTSLEVLDLSGNVLETLDAPLFNRLAGLTTLDASGNALSTWPSAVEALTTLDRLNLATNRIIELPPTVRIADHANYTLAYLDLSANDLLTLPEMALSGLSITVGGTLNVSANPSLGDVLVVDLRPQQLSNSSDYERYQVHSRLPGPIVTIAWQANGGSGSTEALTGSVTIAAGATASDTVELEIAKYQEIRFSNAIIDDPRYIGFTPSVSLLPLQSGQPRFDEPDGYTFARLYANSTIGATIGTVTALNPDGTAPTYILGNTGGRFALSNDGVISYQGAGGETPGTRFDLVVNALGAPDATVAVVVFVNSPPQVDANASVVFTLPIPASSGAQRSLGRIAISDPDNDVLDYVIMGATSATGAPVSNVFSINNQGFLSFIGNAPEDVTSNASYAVAVRASDAALGVMITVTVNIGICDRTQAVRNLLVTSIGGGSCGTVTAAQLESLSSNLSLSGDNTFTALQSFDFAGLTELTQLSLSNSALQSLGEGLFADLSNLTELRINSAQLARLGDRAFAGLTMLTRLELSGNRLTALPQTVFEGVAQGTLNTLLLQENQLSTLPLGVFAGLNVTTELNLSNNSGAPFSAMLSLRQLQNMGDTQRFVVDNARPGPALMVGWEASGGGTILQGTVSVAGGNSVSSSIDIADGYSGISLRSATIDESIYQGFAATFASGVLAINVPDFDRESYDYTLSRGIGSSTTILVTATSPADPTAAAAYTLSGAGADRFTITQGGVFSYSGSGETSNLSLRVSVTIGGRSNSAAISVTVVNDYTPQFIGNGANVRSYTFNLEANRMIAAGIEIGTVIATDGNNEDPSYAITAVSDDRFSLFDVGEASGILFYRGPGERKGATYALSISARDAGDNEDQTMLHITVVGLEFVDAAALVFDAPAYTFTIERGLPADEVMAFGTVYAIDSDNRALAFTAEQDSDRFSITTNNLSDGTSIANGVLHYSGSGELAASSFAIRVMTADAAGETRSHEAIVELGLQSMFAPEFDAAIFYFVLNANDSNVIIGSVTASDRNQETINYSLDSIGNHFSRFSLNAQSGALRYTDSAGSINETIALVVRATDVSASALSVTAAVVININNLTFIDTTNFSSVTGYTFSLSRGANGGANGLLVGTVRAQDSEGGTIAYILSNSAGGLFAFGDSDAFGVRINYLGTGEMLSQTLAVQALTQDRTDATNVFIAGRMADAMVLVAVQNDRLPQFIDAPYEFTLNARQSGVNQPLMLGSVSASDANIETVTFVLDTRSNTADFSINTVYGQGFASYGVLHYIGSGETPNTTLPSVYVLAVDGGGNTVAAEVTVIIAGIVFDMPSYVFSLVHGHAAADDAGTVLGTIRANDSEGETLIYSLQVSNDSSKFSLLNAATNAVELRYMGSGETQNTVLTVNATNANGDRSDSVVVMVVAENSIAPAFVGVPYRFSMNAGVSGQQQTLVVGTVTAIDGNFESPSYRIDSDSTPLNGFSIDPVSGVLRYEGSGELHDTAATLIVRASDAADNAASTTVMVDFVGLRFVPPESLNLPYGLPWIAPMYTFSLSLGVPFGEMTDTQGSPIAFAAVTARDSDGNPITYSIDNDLFRIGPSDGALSYNSARGETEDAQLIVSVTAAELSATAAVLIKIVNNSAPVFVGAPYTFNVAADASGTPNSFIIGNVLATDANRDPLIYSVNTGSAEQAFDTRFEFSDGNQVLHYIGNGETPNAVFIITITARDLANNTASAVIHILIAPTTMASRTQVTDMTVAKVALTIANDTIEVIGGRFSAAPHLIISGNTMRSEWHQMRRLGHWSQLQSWRHVGAWDGTERKLDADWLQDQLGFGFAADLDAKWKKFRANLVASSSFLMRLGADTEEDVTAGTDVGYGGKGGWSFWGKGHLSGYQRTQHNNEVKGNVLSAYFGLDYELRDMFSTGDRLLLGAAIAHSTSGGTFKSSTAADLRADVDTSINTVFPYLQWGSGTGFELWGMFGSGIGTVDVTTVDPLYRSYETDISMFVFGGGAKQVILVKDSVIGSSEMSLKADAFVVSADTDAVEAAQATTASSHRLRFALQDSRRWEHTENITYSGELELGGRMDGGEAADGYGIDVGLGFGYNDEKSGIALNSQGRVLLLHTKDNSEWGLDVTLRVRPKAFLSRGRGFSLILAPGWGQTATKIDTLWQHGASPSLASTAKTSRRLMPDRTKLAISYSMQYRAAFLHPFVEMGMQQDEVEALKMGLKAAVMGMDIEFTADRQRTLNIGWHYGW